MPSAPAPPAAPSPDDVPGMCLLHADFHPMDPGCWSACVDWYFDHQHIPEAAQRDAYAGEVERAMLDELVKKCRLPNVSRST